MASFVKKFDSAVGSKPNDKNIAINAIDNYDGARFSSNAKNAFLEGVFSKKVKNIVALDLGFYKGKERRTLFTLSYSKTGPIVCHVDKETGEEHYDNTKKVPDGYEAIGGYESSGTTNGFQRFVFKKPIDAKSIRVAFDKNSDGTSWLSIIGARAILGTEVTDIPPGPDNGHEDNVTPIDPVPNPTPEPEPEPEKPDQTTIVEGIKIPYAIATGKKKVRTDPNWNKRDDGLRLDFKDNGKDGSYVNNAMVFYGTFKDDIPSDEITFKWSWNNHSGKNIVKSYGIGCDNKTGKTRGRMEWEHPKYTGDLAEGDEKGLPVKNNVSLGYMGIRKTLANGNVLLEYWQDKGGLDDNTGVAANDWVKLLSWEDDKYKVTDYSENGISCTVRIDDEKKGWKNVDVKKALLVELA